MHYPSIIRTEISLEARLRETIQELPGEIIVSGGDRGIRVATYLSIELASAGATRWCRSFVTAAGNDVLSRSAKSVDPPS